MLNKHNVEQWSWKGCNFVCACVCWFSPWAVSRCAWGGRAWAGSVSCPVLCTRQRRQEWTLGGWHWPPSLTGRPETTASAQSPVKPYTKAIYKIKHTYIRNNSKMTVKSKKTKTMLECKSSTHLGVFVWIVDVAHYNT